MQDLQSQTMLLVWGTSYYTSMIPRLSTSLVSSVGTKAHTIVKLYKGVYQCEVCC